MAKRSSTATIDLIGDPKEIARSLKRFGTSTNFVASHYAELRKQYPNTWVAVLDGDVKATARTVPTLLKRIGALGLPRTETLIHFLDAEQRILIL